MALYRFVAKDASGKKFNGEVEVFDEKTLVLTLQKQGLVPIKIRKRQETSLFSMIRSVIPQFGQGGSDVVGFTRQLSTMISAGLPLTDALVILEKQTKNEVFARAISQIV